jgi:hypothetical protein
MESIEAVNSDFKVQSLKVISELSALFFNSQEDIGNESMRTDLKLIIETQFFDL